MRYSKTGHPKFFGTRAQWGGLAVVMGLLASPSAVQAITFTHLPSESPTNTFVNTHLADFGEMDTVSSAVRKDGFYWAMGVTAVKATPKVIRVRSNGSGSFLAAENMSGNVCNDGAGHFTAPCFPNLFGPPVDGQTGFTQGFQVYSYLGTANTTDRNTVYAYVGTDGGLHYGQWKSSVTSGYGATTFSPHVIPGPGNYLGYVAHLIPAAGMTGHVAAPAIASSGSCAIGGITGTCVYFFVQDLNGFIYYKWIACPTNGNCSTLSTDTHGPITWNPGFDKVEQD